MASTRREFLRSSLVTIGGVYLLPPFLQQMAQAAEAGGAGRDKLLLVIQLAGGNDGLNTVIPYTESTYYSSRPSLGIPREQVVQLGGSIGLHPQMAALKRLFDKGELAVLQGVGYPNPDRSHFRSTDIWQTADPNIVTPGEGWLGRYFDAQGHFKGMPLPAVNLGRETPRALWTPNSPVITMANVDEFQIRTNGDTADEVAARVKAFQALYNLEAPGHTYLSAVRESGRRAHLSVETVQERVKKQKNAVTYPQDQFGQGMAALARVAMADAGTRVLYISLGGFDTHANQTQTHATLLGQLSGGIDAFMRDAEAQGFAQDILGFTFSEFGRRVSQNGNNGTDHGTAGPMFVFGGGVKGGVVGDHPSFTDLDKGDFRYMMDFRRVYATVLERWLGCDSAKVLGQPFQAVDFVS